MGMDQAQHTPWEMIWKYMGIMAKHSGIKECLWGYLHNVFIGWSKVFFIHGILLCMVFIYGFSPILIFRVFLSFLERVGINHNKFSTSLHLRGRNNNALDHIWWIFSCEGQNRGNSGGNMMYAYGLDHGELGEQFLVLTLTLSICS